MHRWKAKPGPGLLVGVLLLVVDVVGIGFFGLRLIIALARPPEAWAVSMPLFAELVALIALVLFAGFLVYRIAAVLTLSYEIDRNGVYVLWLGNRAVIPIEDIEMVDSGDRGVRMPWRLLQGIGYYWGQGKTSEGQRLHLFSTSPPSRCLMLHTTKNSYALSPQDQDGFVQNLEQRRRLGAVKPLAPTYDRGRILFYDFWNDRVVRWALILAFGLNLLLLGLLVARYPLLADYIEMRFDAAGNVTELRPRHQILFLPLASFGLILLNTGLGLAIYRREHIGARVLQITSVLLPILFGVAVFHIIGV